MNSNQAIDRLKLILKYGPSFPDYGICFNLSNAQFQELRKFERVTDNSGYDIVEENSSDWEFCSGIEHYPVPEVGSKDKWKGKQLEYRVSLINHIISKLEKTPKFYPRQSFIDS
tara:strand:- start:15 stop:356 length:342 start_codon:yes stop_codon:yes gene_type:complete